MRVSRILLQSQGVMGGSRQFVEGRLNARYAAKSGFHCLNMGKLTSQLKATIQQDRRENGLSQIVDWGEFCEEATSIPTRRGPMWLGKDDPRVVRYMRRLEKMKENVMHIARPRISEDPVEKLESHEHRVYFTTATNLRDPLSVAEGALQIRKDQASRRKVYCY